MADTTQCNGMEWTDGNPVRTDMIPQQAPCSKLSVILVVTRNGHLTEPVMDYAIHVADRLKCKLLVAYVNTLPLLWDGGRRCRLFATAIQESVSTFRAKAAARGVVVDYVQETGRVGKVINRLCHIVKRIEFVVIDKGIKMEEAASRAPVPVFNMRYGTSPVSKAIPNQRQGAVLWEETIAVASRRKLAIIKTAVFASLTATLYTAVFSYGDTIMNYWTRGGIYAILPAATACLFFYVQGSLVSSFRTTLALRKERISRREQESSRKLREKDAEKQQNDRSRT